jgi:hypothetical protein
MAQTAIEVSTENLLAAAFKARGVSELRKPVLDLFTSFNLRNRRLYAVYRALTQDDVNAARPDLWRDYCAHVTRRNDVVHTGKRVTPAEAESSVEAAERFVAYLEDVLRKVEATSAPGAVHAMAERRDRRWRRDPHASEHAAAARVEDYAFESSEDLLESMLGRPLIPGGEHALVTAARRWLSQNDCPREPHARGRGRYLVPEDLARRFSTECWPQIKHLARD